MSGPEYVTFHSAKANTEITHQFLSYVKGENLVDDVALAERGWRYSPEAIRLLMLIMQYPVSGEGDEDSYQVENYYQFRYNILQYGNIMGFNSKIEKLFSTLNRPIPWPKNISKSESDQWITDHPQSQTKMMPVNFLEEHIRRFKEYSPDQKVVLFHGKWNVTHPEHMLFYQESLNKISREYDLEMEQLLPVCICENNSYIESAGKIPFMTTMWRASLMSYFPKLAVVCPGENIRIETARQFYLDFYQRIKPDYIPVEEGDSLTPVKLQTIEEAGLRAVMIPPLINNISLRLSSSLIQTEGMISDKKFWLYQQQVMRLLDSSWRRKWW